MPSFDAWETAASLLGQHPVRVDPVAGGGRNAAIWHIVAADGRRYALKRHVAADVADRLSAEVAALRFMAAHGIAEVPRLAAVDRAAGACLMDWIDGTAALPADAEGVEACLAFLERLHAVRSQGGDLSPAREACPDGAELLRQVDGRILRLQEAGRREPELARFVRQRLCPWRAMVAPRAEACGTSPGQRSLCPSDFGLHNALRHRDGGLVFLDFEYFGWDDPVKLTADFMLHPGMALAPELAARFRDGAERLYGGDPDFAQRLDRLLPLYALRWALILLNEFLPDRWAARRTAGMAGGHAAVKRAQLAKAEAILARMAA